MVKHQNECPVLISVKHGVTLGLFSSDNNLFGAAIRDAPARGTREEIDEGDTLFVLNDDARSTVVVLTKNCTVGWLWKDEVSWW